MPRARKKAESTTETAPVDDTSFNPAEFDQQPDASIQVADIVHGISESTKLPEDVQHTPPNTASGNSGTVGENGLTPRTHAPGFIANPSSTRREGSHAARVTRLPSTMSVSAGDLVVKMIDKGDNLAGIGIRVDLPDGRVLSEDEKAIIREVVKGPDDKPSGYSWNRDAGFWHKPVVSRGEDPANMPPSRPIAIRLDCERRVEQLAEALREHQADPLGFADMVKQRREQAANAQRVPD